MTSLFFRVNVFLYCVQIFGEGNLANVKYDEFQHVILSRGCCKTNTPVEITSHCIGKINNSQGDSILVSRKEMSEAYTAAGCCKLSCDDLQIRGPLKSWIDFSPKNGTMTTAYVNEISTSEWKVNYEELVAKVTLSSSIFPEPFISYLSLSTKTQYDRINSDGVSYYSVYETTGQIESDLSYMVTESFPIMTTCSVGASSPLIYYYGYKNIDVFKSYETLAKALNIQYETFIDDHFVYNWVKLLGVATVTKCE